MRASRKRLVIDASVATSAGDFDATYPASQHCRDFLREVMISGHRAVFNPELQAEWLNHPSNFSTRWLASMERLGKKDDLNLEPDLERRAAMADCLHPDQREACIKDCHLVEAALHTGRTIASRDEAARRHFAEVAADIQFLDVGKIVWTNPANADTEDPITWLRRGAPAEKKRILATFSR